MVWKFSRRVGAQRQQRLPTEQLPDVRGRRVRPADEVSAPTKERVAEGEVCSKSWAERERKRTKSGVVHLLERERCVWVKEKEEQHP